MAAIHAPKTGEAWDAMAIHPDDTVAVALRDLAGEAQVRIGGSIHKVLLREPIPLGHKLALRSHGIGEAVLKYGQSIGTATAAIPAGAHVHVHNMASRRARKMD
ncbi:MULTISPECIES: UxaA family hydrolase [unclassified Chelatococcus]|uniref:UxaA family hydrolase n=1 Tax=unclassified Chelatococcus TaxID=2638111 RepID=UPI001BCE8885|nr:MULTISPECIES: UxaA family hydrolase [unclassified Chelatococcus]MBS7700984.1 UxaA family hydrolase [Chelatococcus sp. YT9]MBX3555517.1 UxaA family hydrolase [Chelatococcus sp.]